VCFVIILNIWQGVFVTKNFWKQPKATFSSYNKKRRKAIHNCSLPNPLLPITSPHFSSSSLLYLMGEKVKGLACFELGAKDEKSMLSLKPYYQKKFIKNPLVLISNSNCSLEKDGLKCPPF